MTTQKALAERALAIVKARLLTPAETSAVLGVAPQTLANWRSAGRGPRFVRLSHKTVRYPEDAVAEFASHELTVREPEDELSDEAIIKQIAQLARRLARRQRAGGGG